MFLKKIYSEIANYLNFSCVNIDFIIDENIKNGLASYDYRELEDNMLIISGDELFLSVFGRKSNKKNNKNITKEDYSYKNICQILLFHNPKGDLLKEFNKIMLMDALTGENDRHFENWGIYCINDNNYKLLPMYDNSSCLLHQFRDNKILEKIMSNNSLEEYILSPKSQCKVSIDGVTYNHFIFIDYLLNNLPKNIKDQLIIDIKKLTNLTDEKIIDIVNKVPRCLCNDKHKNLIIEYIKLRRDILLEKVKKL